MEFEYYIKQQLNTKKLKIVIGNYIIGRKHANIGALLQKDLAYQSGDKIVTQKPLCPKRAGLIEFEAKFS